MPATSSTTPPRSAPPAPEADETTSWLVGLHRLAIRRPVATLVATGLCTLVAATGLPRLDLQIDGRALAPQHAPEVQADREVRARFGIRDPIAIVVSGDAPGSAVDPRVLRFVDSVTAAWSEVDAVGSAHVTSLATEKSFRFRDDSLKFRDLLDPLPETPEALGLWRRDVERIGLYQGTLLADDASAAAIFVGVPDDADRTVFYRHARAIADAHPLPGFRVDVIGAPIAEALLGHHMLDDLGVPRPWLADAVTDDPAPFPGMVPAALLIIGLVLFAALRRVALVLLTLALVGVCLVLVLGVMGWVGAPIFLTLAVLPVLLTALGVADAIHVLTRLQELVRRTHDPIPSLVRVSLDELAAPIVRTSWTTAAALLSFTVSPLEPVRAFGGWAAFGVVLLMIGSLTALPAALCRLPAAWIAPPNERRNAFSTWTRWATRLGLAARRHRLAVWIGVGLVVLVAADGVRRVRVHDSWLDGFGPHSTFADATQRFENRFAGTHRLLIETTFETWRLQVEVDASRVDHHEVSLPLPVPWPDDLPRDAERVIGSRLRVGERDDAAARHGRTARDWRSWVESARFETTNGATRLVVTTPRFEGSPKFWLGPAPGDVLDVELWARPLETPAILERLAELERFLADQPGVGGVIGPARNLRTTAFMMAPDEPASRRLPATPDDAHMLWHNYGVVRGDAQLGRQVTRDRDRSLVTSYLRGSNYTDTRQLMAAIDRFAVEHIAPIGGRVTTAGDVAVSQALIDGVVRTQTLSLALSLGAIWLTASVALRSWRLGLLCVGPSAMVVWSDYALLGWLGIPLGVATSMFAGMTLGIGVDYSLHLLARHHRAERGGLDDPAADALTATIPALITNALAVGLGFGVLLLSQVPGNARLGLLLLASVGGCLIATLVLVPTGWQRSEPRSNTDRSESISPK
ncbi:MAG: MMPL family transporter [Acidobacteriota bacterium]